VRAELQETHAEPVAARLGHLLDEAVAGQGAEQARGRRRRDVEAPRDLVDAEVGGVGEDLEHGERALDGGGVDVDERGVDPGLGQHLGEGDVKVKPQGLFAGNRPFQRLARRAQMVGLPVRKRGIVGDEIVSQPRPFLTRVFVEVDRGHESVPEACGIRGI